MSSESSTTATNSPNLLVTPASSTATLRLLSGLSSLTSGTLSVVSLSCKPLPPVPVALRKHLSRKLVVSEIREHLPGHPLPGLDGPVHVPAPLRGGLRPGPVDLS